jgi:hemerythrin-like domain-containing protein
MDSSLKSSYPARPQRNARPREAQAPGFEALDNAHRAALTMLERFEQLVAHLDQKGLDDDARVLAREVMAYFNGPGRHHHEEEERHVFPGLLAGTEVELVQHVRRLQQDHGWLEEDWRELAPQVEAIANGYNWYELAMLKEALPIFKALYLDHIKLEETVVYPAAKRQHQALADGRGARIGG